MFSEDIIDAYRNDAQGLAEYFSREYFRDRERVFPINPFQVLTDLGIHFVFRSFDNLEALFMPAAGEGDVDLVAINVNRPITRQRFSAAHELCHYLKDAGLLLPFMCMISAKNEIERYAESFAAAFLMPADEMKRQVKSVMGDKRKLSLEDVLRIAHYFGTSFMACFYRIRRLFPRYLPYVAESELSRFKPMKKRAEWGLTYAGLYADLFDAFTDLAAGDTSDFAAAVFKNRYVFNDARIEGVPVSFTAAAEIIDDLKKNRQKSIYCNDDYEGFCSVAGHSQMYDLVFEKLCKTPLNIYQLTSLHRELFSCFPNPEFGGKTRKDNVCITGASVNVCDWREVAPALIGLNEKVNDLEITACEKKKSEIVKEIAGIHHRIVVIHPFSDGNGRSARGFMNAQLSRYGLVPFYIRVQMKGNYIRALEAVNREDNYEPLYEFFFKAILFAHAELASG